MKTKTKMTIALTVCITLALITVGTVLATTIYVFNPSNPTTGTVGPSPSPSPTPNPTVTVNTGLTLSPSTIVDGDTWTLTATLDTQLSGITVTFYEGTTVVGTALTNAQGIATLTLTPSVGSHTYTAQPSA